MRLIIKGVTVLVAAFLTIGVATPVADAAAPQVLTTITIYLPSPKAFNFAYVGSHALDQDGKPMAGVPLTFSVTSNGSDSHGTVTTDADGVAIFRYTADHVGPEHASITGPNGTPTKDGDTTVAPFPITSSLTATSKAKGEVTLRATNNPNDSRVSGIMAFYQYVAGSNGQYKYVAQKRLFDYPGYATYTFTNLQSGAKLGFRTRLGGSADYISPLSPGVTVTVK